MSGATHYKDVLTDCDNGPTKTWLLEHRTEHPRAFALCFGKRPAEELYDLAADPWQLENLATDPARATVRARLAARLDEELLRLGDPRVVGGAEIFDESPYRGRTR